MTQGDALRQDTTVNKKLVKLAQKENERVVALEDKKRKQRNRLLTNKN